MKKKLCSLLLCAAMAMGLLAGCGGQEDGEAQTEEAGKTQNDEGTEEKTLQGAVSTEENTEVTTVNLYAIAIGTVTDLQMVEDAVNEISREKIGVEVNINLLDPTQWVEQRNLLINGGEDVDLLLCAGTLASDVSQGALLELEDLYAQYGQDIQQYYEEEYLQVGYINGHLYGIAPQKEFAGRRAIVYRKDIVDELGIDVSNVKTLEDWMPVMAQVKEAYPDMICYESEGGSTNNAFKDFDWDGLGDDLGVLMDPANDTEIVNLYETDHYEELVRTMRKWYEAGYVSKDTATATESSTTLIAAGNVFCSMCIDMPGGEEANTLACGYPMAHIPLTQVTSTTGNVAGVMWTIPYVSKNPEAAMKLLNLMYSDAEIEDLLNFGIEGVHYMVQDNGLYNYVEGQDDSSCTYHPLMNWIWPNSYIAGTWEGKDPELSGRMMEFNKNATKSMGLGFQFDNSAVINEVTACQNVIKQYAFGLEVGAVDVDTVLPEFRQALQNAGIDRVIAEKQAQFDAWLAQKEQ